GPCAFMEQFDINTYFSSIDTQGRYRYGNQPSILGWNLARLAETLLPLFDEDPNHAIDIANSTMAEFTDIMNNALEAEDVQEVEGDITVENHKRDPQSPITIPRNQPLDKALKEATDGDLTYYFELLEAVKKPHEYHPDLSNPGDLADLIKQLRILAQLLTVGRNHFVQLVGPADHVLTEAALQKLQHDCWGNRCARRCTEQTSDATFWVVDQGGAKFQGTETRSSRRLDNLYALTSYNGLPICAISAWHVLA